jgi:hypothetical protein
VLERASYVHGYGHRATDAPSSGSTGSSDLVGTQQSDPAPREETHLAEWYRVLMAAHIRPAHGIRSPSAVKDRLPDLDWLPADARRLAWGRELSTLASTYAQPESAAALSLVLPLGNKGWLSQDDVTDFLDRLHGMDPRLFRRQQNLVPLVEEVHTVLTAVASVPDRVLLLPPS